MKLRSRLALPAIVAALALGTMAPAQAAPTDPVTDLTVTVVQAPGSSDSWKVTASWTPNPEATSYSVVIADRADGTVTSGKSYGNQDTKASTVSFTTSRLVADRDYWVAVQPIAPSDGTVAVQQFHTNGLDTTAPTGDYRLTRTSAYLLSDEAGTSKATTSITQVVATDAATRRVVAGDGTPAREWASGQSFTLTYADAGTFTPHVLLSDEFGNTSDIALPAVTVLTDATPPVVRFSRPRKPGAVASWRTLRGTASDAESGVVLVGVMVMEKRGSLWWVYDFKTKKWLKGLSSPVRTGAKTKANPALVLPRRNGSWRAPAIAGLRPGLLRLEAIAIDGEFNFGHTVLTRQVR